MIEPNKIYNMDCLEGLKLIANKSVDMVLCDLPYGTTQCKWDSVLPLNELWEQYKRIIKDKGAIVLTASQPFTTQLINSNPRWFKYSWVWDKGLSGNIFLAKYQPMKIHEDILVFSNGVHNYFPIKTFQNKRTLRNNGMNQSAFGDFNKYEGGYTNLLNPKSIIYFPNTDRRNIKHPTEKPLALFRYLIKTYTREGDLVLDNTSGVGTTALACKQTNRRYICFEIDKNYCEVAQSRLNQKALWEMI